MTSPQQHADALLAIWQLQRLAGVRPEDRKLEQDNELGFYEWQLRLLEEQMDMAV